MDQSSGTDPVFGALDRLVRDGHLTPERARAAWDASRDPVPAGAYAGPPAGTGPTPSGVTRPGPGDPRYAAPSWGPLRLETALIAVAVGLLAATVLLSTGYARARDDLDWSNFLLGLAATLGLLGVAAAAHLLVRDPARRGDLVAWPGAFGAVAAGLMVGVAMDDQDATLWVVGLLVVALSVAGYLLERRAPFVVSAILGLFLLWVKLFDEAFGVVDFGEGDDAGIAVSAGLLLFTVAVTAGGWLLPTRVLSGVVAGVVAVVGNVTLLYALGIVGALQAAFAGFGEEGVSGPPAAPFRNDAWFVLVFCLALVAGWVWCAWRTGAVGFRILVVAMAAGVVPAATVVLVVDHPTWWEVAVGVPGGLLLLALLGRAAGLLPQSYAAPRA